MSIIKNLKIVETFPLSPTGKTIIQAFTGSGLVASLVSHHLIDKFEMVEKGYVASKLLPSVGIVRDGIIQRPVRIFENSSYILILSEIGVAHENLGTFLEELFDWYTTLDPASIVVVGALPTGRPANATDLRYSVVASDDMTRDFLSKKGIWTMPQGAVYGSVALSLMEAKRSGLASYAILSHCIATIPDYLAAKKVVEILAVTLDEKIELDPLTKNAMELKDHLVEREERGELDDDEFEIENYELYDDYSDEEDDDDLSEFI